MYITIFYGALSIFIISLISLIGVIIIPFKKKKFQRGLMYAVAFSAGAMLGDAFLHLLPEVISEVGSFRVDIAFYTLGGILTLFLVEKIIRWRHCHDLECDAHVKPFAIINLVGDGIHNMIDGLIIGASYMVSIPLGIASTFAIAFHEIPQEISDFGVLLSGGLSRNKALFYNFLSSCMAFVGLIIIFIFSTYSQSLIIFFLPFAAGHFIYIAAADLIPEMHRELDIHNSLYQILALIFGIGVMYALLLIG